MPICFALDNLYLSTVAVFARDGVDVESSFGWRAPNRHVSAFGKRVVWTPGDENGRLGLVGAPKRVGQNPRPIGTLSETFTVRISSADNATPESEMAQYRSARELFDLWYSACHESAAGNFRIVDSRWDTSKTERRHGAMIVCVCAIDAPLSKAQGAAAAPADAEANVTTEVAATVETTIEPA